MSLRRKSRDSALAMRLTTWNCLRGSITARRDRLKPLSSDLVALQECERQNLLELHAWSGTLNHKGVSVVVCNDAWSVEVLGIPGLPPTVIAAVVNSAEPFLFVGMWTQKEPTYAQMAIDALTSVAGCASGLPVVTAGDFNVSPRVTGQTHSAPAFYTRLRDDFGLVSAYHASHGCRAGDESHPTFYMNGKQERPFHLDYCFVPEAWTDRIRQVEVGTFGDWRDSDHRPLTVEIE